ncbi:MAG: hypothetical protein KDK66_02270 [Deltaproteobacteria bacterium]|nr:hypothetical protein [Deltaproteobacteria bacterium]
MQKALRALNQSLARLDLKAKLLIGGGGAFNLAYAIPLRTQDIDGVLFKSDLSPHELDQAVKQVAKELKLPPDWLNPYFETFLYCLPTDYADRLLSVYKASHLQVFALSIHDLLVMKCFAGREKDLPHAKLLVKKGADLNFVQEHMEKLKAKGIPDAAKALDFLYEVEDSLED